MEFADKTSISLGNLRPLATGHWFAPQSSRFYDLVHETKRELLVKHSWGVHRDGGLVENLEHYDLLDIFTIYLDIYKLY